MRIPVRSQLHPSHMEGIRVRARQGLKLPGCASEGTWEMKESASRFYVYLLTNTANANEGVIRVAAEELPDARKLSELGTKEEAEAFAESAAIAFQSAGMIVVYDPD